MWGPGVSVGRRGMQVPFQDSALLGLGPNLGLGKFGPPGLLFFSLFPFHFLFLISDLNQILCNLDSKHFK
jgi:hypothetical protein